MKKSILEKLERLSERLAEIDGLLGGEHAAKDMDSYRKLTRERADITPVVELFHAYRSASADFSGAAEMLDDPEMKELALAEQVSATSEMARLAAEPFIPRGTASADDETVWEFAARRLGAEVADRLVSPMSLGIFAGDARRLQDIQAKFPNDPRGLRLYLGQYRYDTLKEILAGTTLFVLREGQNWFILGTEAADLLNREAEGKEKEKH